MCTLNANKGSAAADPTLGYFFAGAEPNRRENCRPSRRPLPGRLILRNLSMGYKTPYVYAKRQQGLSRRRPHLQGTLPPSPTPIKARSSGHFAAAEQEAKKAGKQHKKGLNREILSQGWGIIRQQLEYKAEWAGRQLVKVNPSYTSRICSECGFVNGKAQEYRTFNCSECGHIADRDVNAALNILKRGWEFAAGSITDGLPSVLPETYAEWYYSI